MLVLLMLVLLMLLLVLSIAVHLIVVIHASSMFSSHEAAGATEKSSSQKVERERRREIGCLFLIADSASLLPLSDLVVSSFRGRKTSADGPVPPPAGARDEPRDAPPDSTSQQALERHAREVANTTPFCSSLVFFSVFL